MLKLKTEFWLGIASVVGVIVLIYLSLLRNETADIIPTDKLSVSSGFNIYPTIPLEQLATHNYSADCWILIDGSIYNLTSLISPYPDSDNLIQSRCGTDATLFFKNQNRANLLKLLDKLKIGVSAQ